MKNSPVTTQNIRRKGSMNMQVKDKVIAVTGAGGGIGSALVKVLLEKGAKVAALDINESSLKQLLEKESLYKDRLSIHKINITDMDAVLKLPDQIAEVFGHVDGIINNAGIIQHFIPILELPIDNVKRVMDINFYGTLYMIKSFLPHLLKRPEGHIVNISSMGGFLPVPGQSVYGASKAAIKLLSEGLYSELLNTSVHVTVVFPGGVATDITKNSDVVMKEMNEKKTKNYTMMSPLEAAEMIIKGMEKNKYHVYAGKDSKFMNIFSRLMPKKSSRLIANQMKDLL